MAQGRARAKQARQPFLDNVKVQEAGRFHVAIPESLRPKMGHLSPPQQRVYEDFARIPRNPMAAAKQVDQVLASQLCLTFCCAFTQSKSGRLYVFKISKMMVPAVTFQIILCKGPAHLRVCSSGPKV